MWCPLARLSLRRSNDVLSARSARELSCQPRSCSSSCPFLRCRALSTVAANRNIFRTARLLHSLPDDKSRQRIFQNLPQRRALRHMEMAPELVEIASHRCFGGTLRRFEHISPVLGDCTMKLSAFIPSAAQNEKFPGVIWLSGLTCTDENFAQKAGAFQMAEELKLILIMPDTSPRGEGVPDEDPKTYDFGTGAGFYLNATTPKYEKHYNMLDYIVQELPPMVASKLPLLPAKLSIMGHSMGGHGALIMALKNPGLYRSVSAFSPITHPTEAPWGQKAFSLYLGEDQESWKEYDAVELVKQYDGPPLRLLVDQGTADTFLSEQLKPGALKAACDEKGVALTLRMQPGYDHSYYFIASFIQDHLKYHASYLTGVLQWCPDAGTLPEPSELYSDSREGEEEVSETANQEIECLAAVAFQPKKPLELVKVKVAPPQKGEVRIKHVAVTLCHTDAHTLSCEDPEGLFPSIFGHQASGIVESVGEEVVDFKPGDHVIPCYQVFCGEQPRESSLRSSARAFTGKGVMAADGNPRFTYEGEPIYHFMGTSSFSEYSVVHAQTLVKLRKDAPLEEASLLGGVSTGWGAVWNTAQVERGATAAVFGVGAVGLSVVEGLVKVGASKIIAVDAAPSKLQLAKAWGATDTINPQDIPEGTTVQECIVDMTGSGADYTFDCTGDAQAMQSALEASSRSRGKSTVIDVAGADQEIATRPFQLTGRSWQGTAFGGWQSKAQVPILVDLYMSGELKIDEYISHRMKFEEINEAFELLKEGDCLRCLLKFGGQEETPPSAEESTEAEAH